MFLKIIDQIPFIQCLTYFPRKTHSTALKKFGALWVLTSLPVIVAAMLSKVPPGTGSLTSKLITRLGESISVSEQFVYTASFLAPVLYILYEKYKAAEDSGSDKPWSDSFRVFKGYGWVVIAALLVMFCTASAFSALKTSSTVFESTFLHHVLVNGAPSIYIFSLYCWYLTLLDGAFVGDYSGTTKMNESGVTKELGARLRARKSA